MRTTFNSLTLVLAASLAISACSKKSEGGGAGAPPVSPYGPNFTYTNSDSFDNSRGAIAISSVRGTPIKNLTLSLVDLDGNDSGYTARVMLHFNNEGILSAIALVDATAFDAARMNMAMGIDPWSRHQQQQQPTQANRLITYKALNIPYEFNANSGLIKIWDFAAGSNVGQTSNYSNMGMAPGAQSQSRLGIFVKGTNYRTRSLLGGAINLRASTSRGYFEGQLVNLATGYAINSGDSVGFNPQNAGFEIRSQVAVGAGEIIQMQDFRVSYSNNNFQPMQTTRDEFMPNYMKNSFLYSQPVLDPRVQP